MSVAGKDSLYEASAGVVLTAHTPGGAGATGGPWAAAATTSFAAPSSYAGGGFNGSSANGDVYLSASGASAPDYVQAVVQFAADEYAGVALYPAGSTGNSQGYQWQRQQGSAFKIMKDGGSGVVATAAIALTLNHPYLMRLERTVSGSTATLTAYLDGVQVCQATDSTSAYTGTLSGGLALYAGGGSVNLTAFEAGTFTSGSFAPNLTTVYPSAAAQVELILTGIGTGWSGTPFGVTGGTGASVASQTVLSGTSAVIKLVPGTAAGTLTLSDGTLTAAVTVAAGSVVPPNSANLRHVGPVNVGAQEAVTVTTGRGARFAFTGDTARVRFNVGTLSVYPDVIWRTDRDAYQRASLSAATPYITLAPAYNSTTTVKAGEHVAELWYSVFEGVGAPQPTINEWSAQLGAVRLAGVDLPGTGALLTAPPMCPNLLACVGDSITQTVRTFYTGSASDQTVEAPHLGWPALLADGLRLDLIQLGYGGTGVTVSGSGGVPAAPASFGFCYAGAAYTAANPPAVTVIYHGTNDTAATSAAFQAAYVSLLAVVRAAWPKSLIFAVNPHSLSGASSRLPDITAAAAGVANVFVLDATSAGTAGTDLVDGAHLSPGGHNRLSNWLAYQVQTKLNTLGVKAQTAGGVPRVGSSQIGSF